MISDSAPPPLREPIHHITTPAAWGRDGETAAYRHDSLSREGFIHCSFTHQVRPTWERVFDRAPGLIVITLDPRRIDAEVRVEEGEPGEWFPHVFGTIPRSAVTAIGRPEEF